jgi:hypothetical protein
MSLVTSSIVKGCFAAAVLTLIFAPSLARAQLFTLSSITGAWDYDDSGTIRQVNPATGATISIQGIRLPPGSYGFYTTGLAAHPATGEFFVLMESAPGPRGPTDPWCRHLLAKLDPATGAATIIGNTGICFASLAFHRNGTLYGVTLSEGAVPPALFTLDTTNATPTFLISFEPVSLSSGAVVGGSGLAFNPNDGLLYRSGRVDVSDQIFQAIDPDTLAVTDIPRSGSPTDEIIALTHSFENTLLGADVGNRLVSITTEGVRTLIGPMDHLARGLAFATNRTAPLPPLTLASILLPDAEVGVAYTAPLVSGGLPPYTINLVKGAFPQGLSDSLASGALSGTPASSKGRSFTAQITDDLGSSVTGTFTIKIFPALGINARALKTGINGKPYKATLKAAGGKKPYNWSLVSGSLPLGLSLDPLTGAITGIPTETGTFDLTFHVTDPVGGIAETALTLTIN